MTNDSPIDIDSVVDNHLCAGCGACYGVCPSDAIEMRETLDGRIEPNVRRLECSNCGLCNSVCPQTGMAARMVEVLEHSLVGPVVDSHLTRPCDENMCLEGQTCGTVRALIKYCLESGAADGALCVCEDQKNPLRPEVRVLRTAGETHNVSKSKYCPVNWGEAIRYIRRHEGRYIVVGLGCQMQALERAMERSPVVRTRVKLRLGLFCDRILKYSAAEFLLKKAGVDAGNVAGFDYRHKAWRGYPGDVRVVDAAGGVANVDRVWRKQMLPFYTPAACRLCVDKLNVLSDIALGDAWGIDIGTRVRTATIVRTQAGSELLTEAEAAGIIQIDRCSSAQIVRGQHVDRRLAQCSTLKENMLRRGFAVPAVLGSSVISQRTARARLTDSLGLCVSLWAEGPRGGTALKHLPVWVVRIVGALNRSMRFLRRCRGYAIRRVRAKADRSRR